MSVHREAPPERAKARTTKIEWDELLDAAIAEPGEWFSMEIPDELPSSNVSGSLSFAVYKRVAEHAVRDRRLYFRMRAPAEIVTPPQ